MAEIAANAGHLGDVVVIELGYNDKPSASAIDAALSALTAQDVPLVLWVDLSTLNRPDFAPVNDRLQAATTRWPTMRAPRLGRRQQGPSRAGSCPTTASASTSPRTAPPPSPAG